MTPATIRVGGRVEVTDLPRDVELAICRALTYRNPEHDRRERLGLYTGHTEPHIATWSRIPGGLSVPRGTGGRVVTLLREAGVPYATVDRSICPPLGVTVTPGQLRPYQQEAHDALARQRCGVLQAQTGSGKTINALAAIATLQTTALICVHTRELVRQWADRCGSWLGVTPGVIGSGRWDVQPITIASVQTLAKRIGTPEMAALAAHVGLVIVDECHHAPAWQHASVLDHLPARFRYGLSATPWRKDGLDAVITDYLGPVTARVTPEQVREAGATVVPRYEIVETVWRYTMSDDPHAWTQMLTALVDDETRNRLLSDEVCRRLDAGASVLVLTDRVAHVEVLAHLLTDRAPVVLHGGRSAADRATGMAAMRNGARLTIATAGLMGEGIDAPGWDTLVMASPMAGGPRTLQAVGRVVRPAPGKTEAVVVDLVDVHVPALVAAYYSRRRLYREAA